MGDDRRQGAGRGAVTGRPAARQAWQRTASAGGVPDCRLLRSACWAAVVVATTTLERQSGGLSFWNALAIFGAATLAVLAGASLFALGSSALVAYFLSRRLVQRLERAGKAAESLAAGDLSCRVEEGRNDELGQLARRLTGWPPICSRRWESSRPSATA